MEYIKIRKADSYIVPCVVEIPDHPKGIVIVIHGFSSSKECETYKMLLRRLPEAGYGMIGIELPGHGKEEALQETGEVSRNYNLLFRVQFWSIYHRALYQYQKTSW